MKKTYILVFLFLLWISGHSQEIKKDSIPKKETSTIVSVSFQPTIGKNFFGIGFYVNGIVVGLGAYGSSAGLKKNFTEKTQVVGASDILVNTITDDNSYGYNIGLSCKTVKNFYIYAGYSMVTAQVATTTTYKKTTNPNKGSSYEIVTVESKDEKGVDFGGIYYAGTGILRMGIQAGFNTALKTTIVGLHIGIHI